MKTFTPFSSKIIYLFSDALLGNTKTWHNQPPFIVLKFNMTQWSCFKQIIIATSN